MASQNHIRSPQEIPAEKHCSKCKLPKPITDFHKKTRNKDGHKYACKSCSNAASGKWKKDNPEKHAADVRRWRNNNPEKVQKMVYRYFQLNPAKKHAHMVVYRAIKSGKLIRPQSCSSCKIKCRPHAHHWSYLLEHRLDVIWLCGICHAQVHQKERRNHEK